MVTAKFFNNCFKMHLQAFLTVIAFFLSFNLVAQEIPAKETALCWFNLAVEQDMYLPMELEAETLMAITFQKDNPEAKELMENSLAVVYNKINEETAITLLPVESLKEDVRYSRMGYPLASLKKASKKGDFKQYARIDIEVSGARRSSNTFSRELSETEVDHGVQRVKVKPQIRVTLKFADKDGNTIDKVQGVYRHEEKVEITSRRLSTMGWSLAYDQEADAIPYYYFLEKAVEDLVKKLD